MVQSGFYPAWRFLVFRINSALKETRNEMMETMQTAKAIS